MYDPAVAKKMLDNWSIIKRYTDTASFAESVISAMIMARKSERGSFYENVAADC